MEVKFREASNVGKLTELHRAMQIPAKMVNDPINSSGIFAVSLALCAWHGFYRHYVVETPRLALSGRDSASLLGSCSASSRMDFLNRAHHHVLLMQMNHVIAFLRHDQLAIR